MFTLSESQRSWLTLKLNRAEALFADQLQRINGSTDNPGETANRLVWHVTALAEADLLRRNLRQLIYLADAPDSAVTLEILTERYTEEILRSTPERSTNPVSNLVSELKREAHQETLQTLVALRDRS